MERANLKDAAKDAFERLAPSGSRGTAMLPEVDESYTDQLHRRSARGSHQRQEGDQDCRQPRRSGSQPAEVRRRLLLDHLHGQVVDQRRHLLEPVWNAGRDDNQVALFQMSRLAALDVPTPEADLARSACHRPWCRRSRTSPRRRPCRGCRSPSRAPRPAPAPHGDCRTR